MKIFKLCEKDKDSVKIVEGFLKKREEKCVQLCANFRKSLENIFVIFDEEFFSEIKDENIVAVFYVTKTFLFCFSENYLSKSFAPVCSRDGEAGSDRNNVRTPNVSERRNTGILEKTLRPFLLEKKIKVLSGEKSGCDFIKSIFEEKFVPFQVNSYDFFVLNEKPNFFDEKLSCGDEIRRCTSFDFDSLIDLQRRYLQEEVAPEKKIVSEVEVSASLKQIFESQLIFGGFSDGEIVSKANTNAIGWNFIQIGGVYTNPLYRRNGFAFCLVYELCNRIYKSQKKSCLFVKCKNEAAKSLYKKIGFCSDGKYEIVYY